MRFLEIAAGLYGYITRLRNKFYDEGLLAERKGSLPIICVGNLSVGGNGKTPLVRLLASELANRGYAPVVLSRGYGGSSHRPRIVDSSDDFRLVGDEPLLLSQSGVKVVTSRDRVKGALFVEKRQLGDVIILDDGFQHRRLKRDVDIICVATGSESLTQEFLDARLLPLGYFRESRDEGLQRAGMVVFSDRVSRKNAVPPVLDPRLLAVIPKEVTVYRSFVQPEGVFSLDNGEEVSPLPVIAVTGIARPGGFFETLEQMDFPLIESRAFPDHFNFPLATVRRLVSEFSGNIIVITEKDAVKIRALPKNLHSHFGVLRIRTRVTPEDAFMVQVQRLLAFK